MTRAITNFPEALFIIFMVCESKMPYEGYNVGEKLRIIAFKIYNLHKNWPLQMKIWQVQIRLYNKTKRFTRYPLIYIQLF